MVTGQPVYGTGRVVPVTWISSLAGQSSAPQPTRWHNWSGGSAYGSWGAALQADPGALRSSAKPATHARAAQAARSGQGEPAAGHRRGGQHRTAGPGRTAGSSGSAPGGSGMSCRCGAGGAVQVRQAMAEPGQALPEPGQAPAGIYPRTYTPSGCLSPWESCPLSGNRPSGQAPGASAGTGSVPRSADGCRERQGCVAWHRTTWVSGPAGPGEWK